tara:strand:- start:2046 stop:2333 length:288 start_codon:yes stop_codon:yes gene_type:complete
MTEKDITRIAEATAKIVIDHIEAKQDEWNNEFEVNLEHFTSNSTMQPYKLTDEQELLNIEISELKLRLDKAIAAENYVLASKLNSKIIDLKTKLN